MVRYITLQYRDDLLLLRQTELDQAAAARPPSTTVRRQSNSNSRSHWSRSAFSEQQKDEVATDLLSILQRIPIQVIGKLPLFSLFCDLADSFSGKLRVPSQQSTLCGFYAAGRAHCTTASITESA
jgi:hypothetical protein